MWFFNARWSKNENNKKSSNQTNKQKAFTTGQQEDDEWNICTGWMKHTIPLHKKATIHQVTTMLATSKNVLFPGHNHLLTTGTGDPSPRWCSGDNQSVESSAGVVSRWLWPGNRTSLEVDITVATWWIVAFLTQWWWMEHMQWMNGTHSTLPEQWHRSMHNIHHSALSPWQACTIHVNTYQSHNLWALAFDLPSFDLSFLVFLYFVALFCIIKEIHH